MKNFSRVVSLALRHRLSFALAVACSLGVAILWGGNLGMIKTAEIIFTGKSPHTWADDQVTAAAEKITASRRELKAVKQRLAAAPADQRTKLQTQQHALAQRLAIEDKVLAAAKFYQPLVKRYLPDSAFLTLVVFLSLLVLATIVKDLLLMWHMILIERISQLSILELRTNLFRQTLSFEQARFGADRTSGLMARFTNDIAGIYQGLNTLLGKLVVEPLKMLACLVGAALISWRLLALSLLVAPLAAWIIYRLTKSLKRANRRALEETEVLYGVMSDTFTGVQAVQAFGMEGHERRKFYQTGKQVFHRQMRIAFYSALGRVSVETLSIAIICLAMAAGAYLVINQETTLLGIPMTDRPLSLVSMLTFFAFLAGISDPARKMSEVLHTLQRAAAGADRVYELLDRQPAIVDPIEPRTLATTQPELVFENVSFHYQPEEPVLNEVSLRIPFGETVAIVGPNGCGKTTLTNLLPRFYDPVAGAIRLGGIDLRELRLRDLRGMVGIVAQQAMLFDDTVLSNIRYGSPRASDDEAIEAAKKAHAHRFIEEKLDSGYATIVGERGGRLSGGQRQRILLARAILRDPKFLILDEATSQIDLESEQLIHKVLEQFRRGRTTLLITHRVSSIALADRIVVMDQGRIIDSGTHDELLGRCSLYSRLRKLGFEQVA